MVAHRILVPLAYAAPLQTVAIALLLRWLSEPGSWFHAVSWLAGCVLGLALSVLELWLLTRPKRG